MNVIEGNYAFSRGEYQEANLDYLKVQDKKLYKNYLSYNLGNVYYALGEVDSAFTEWNSIDSNIVDTITLRSFFNTGVLLFELSRYEEAYAIFRNILELDSSNLNAKINLEHCIQKMNFSTENKVKSQDIDIEELEKTEDVSRVLDFVKRRESHVWTPPSKLDQEESTEKDW